jgi:hypothetical protein
MAKPPYYRIFLNESGKNYLLCRLWQQKSDESLMLQMQPGKNTKGGTIGKIEVTGSVFDIHFDDITTPADIEHTTLHATGQSHTKMKDGSLSINYDKDHAGIPLTGLKTIKHLGTLISRDMAADDETAKSRVSDVSIERGTGQKFSVLDILAVPKGVNFNFTTDWDMENKREVKMTIGLHRLGFNGFDVIIFTRSSDQFDKVPPKTLHLPDMNNIVPFVTKLDDKKATIKLSELTFNKVFTPQTKSNPYDGFTGITATSKYV